MTPACLSKHFWHAKLKRKGSHKKVNHRLKRESNIFFLDFSLISCIHDLSVQFQIPEMLSLVSYTTLRIERSEIRGAKIGENYRDISEWHICILIVNGTMRSLSQLSELLLEFQIIIRVQV